MLSCTWSYVMINLFMMFSGIVLCFSGLYGSRDGATGRQKLQRPVRIGTKARHRQRLDRANGLLQQQSNLEPNVATVRLLCGLLLSVEK